MGISAHYYAHARILHLLLPLKPPFSSSSSSSSSLLRPNPSPLATTTTATTTTTTTSRSLLCCFSSHGNPRRVRESRGGGGGSAEGESGFVVASFYKFVLVADPEAEVAKQLSFLQGRNIHGRIYVNEQGINAQYSGPTTDAMAYVEWLREDPRFSDILVQLSPALSGHAFPRLKLRIKILHALSKHLVKKYEHPSLLLLEGGVSHLPLVDPSMRATPLTPSEWRKRLQNGRNVDIFSSNIDSSASEKEFLLLDVRNGYEWDIGHFRGAERPNVDCFRSTSFGFSEQEVDASDPLTGVDKECTDILMYCTGGIRCDVYSTILRQKGFRNLYTLSGGVSNYLKSEGPAEWLGNLFVFDSRLSLPPSTYNPEKDSEGEPQLVSESTMLGKCYICGSQLLDFRHRNCANLDCNRLFLCCSSCAKELRGCCGADCVRAPRLRPVLLGRQRYQKWHIYRDGEFPKEITA
uniref:Rhodanese domain-containing protein n=1 Tax=Ananas comosus var. bracteatus TaxID=296719 RepID=A0A6V7NKF6_ANACO|nr:unnamed protein product [Ananas comosus var. bracteatus]